jgi:hypothetical protein
LESSCNTLFDKIPIARVESEEITADIIKVG